MPYELLMFMLFLFCVCMAWFGSHKMGILIFSLFLALLFTLLIHYMTEPVNLQF